MQSQESGKVSVPKVELRWGLQSIDRIGRLVWADSCPGVLRHAEREQKTNSKAVTVCRMGREEAGSSGDDLEDPRSYSEVGWGWNLLRTP